MWRRVLPAILVLGLAVCAFAPTVRANHWNVALTYSPTTVFMETDQVFTLILRNDGPDPVAVSEVQMTFDWVTSGFRYTVSSTTFNLAPANEQRLTRTIPVPRLVAGSVHSLSIFVTAQTNGDLFAEEIAYSGQVTAQESPPPEAVAGVLLCGAGIVVGVIILVLIIVLVVRRRPRGPPVIPMAVPGAPPAQACPTCGRPLAFVSQYQRWYCSAENKYV